MKYNRQVLFIIFPLFCIISCSDIFETDIQNEEIKLFTPREGLVTENPIISFWWSYIEGAEGYHLQVAIPSFDADEINKLVLDTIVETEKFEYVFYPSTFEWRIYAFNNISSTDYAYGTFKIDSTPNLYDVILISPVSNYATNDSSITFSWQKQDNADSYRFEISHEGELIFADLLTENKIMLPGNRLQTALLEGNYEWKVQAQSNSVPPSRFSTRTFIIDRTKPGKPSLVSPKTGETITGNQVTMKWTRTGSSLASISDSLWISADSSFSEDAIFNKYYLQAENKQVEISETGKYFWKVKSIDAAGNKSEWSIIKSFIRSEE